MVDGKYVPNFNGKKGSPFGIKPEDLNDQVWDFIMLNGPPPKNCKIPKVQIRRLSFSIEIGMSYQTASSIALGSTIQNERDLLFEVILIQY